MSCSVMVSGFVLMVIVDLVFLNVFCFLCLGDRLCIVSSCSRCDGRCTFCLICDASSLRYSWGVSIFVSSCMCCVNPVEVLNAALSLCIVYNQLIYIIYEV